MAKQKTTYVALKRLWSLSQQKYIEAGAEYVPPAEAKPEDIQTLIDVKAIAEQGSDEAKSATEVSDGSNS